MDKSGRMLARFCLYGFLKNQQYYDPFLILFFRQRGLSFGMIGLLIGFRAICINLFEIPTGAIADVLGRRRAMIVSFVAYISSFLVFALCDPLWALFTAMLMFSVGEAFRTGTHKAMIFDWLDHQGRQEEKTAIYGITRSWGKMGSAISVVIATGLVFFTEQYASIFLFCTIPYLLNIINFMGYPSYLDGPRQRRESTSGVLKTLMQSLKQSLRHRPLRRLLVESMGYEGIFQSTKDYVQPVIKTAALALPLLVIVGNHFDLADRQRVAIGVGVVYFTLYVLSSLASRWAGRFAEKFGDEDRASKFLWQLDLLIFSMMAGAILMGFSLVIIAAFVLLAVFQNLWRPLLVSRVVTLADPSQSATILSIESQGKSLFVAVTAPLVGLAVDWATRGDGQLRFLPIAIVGIVVSALMLLSSRHVAEPQMKGQ